jgi:hypothetical protein
VLNPSRFLNPKCYQWYQSLTRVCLFQVNGDRDPMSWCPDPKRVSATSRRRGFDFLLDRIRIKQKKQKLTLTLRMRNSPHRCWMRMSSLMTWFGKRCSLVLTTGRYLSVLGTIDPSEDRLRAQPWPDLSSRLTLVFWNKASEPSSVVAASQKLPSCDRSHGRLWAPMRTGSPSLPHLSLSLHASTGWVWNEG